MICRLLRGSDVGGSMERHKAFDDKANRLEEKNESGLQNTSQDALTKKHGC